MWSKRITEGRAGLLRRAAVIGFAALLCAGRGLAAEPGCTAGDRACGRAAFSRGTSAFDHNDYTTALAEFARALAAEPHPAIAFNIALCHARLGQLKLARRELDALSVDQRLPAALAQRASAELADIAARLAHLSLDAVTPEAYELWLDGAALERSDTDFELDPGPHHLRVTRDGALVTEQDVTLGPGERLRLRVTSQTRTLDVVVVPSARSAPAAAAAKAEPARRAAPSVERSRGPAVTTIVFYAGVALTVVLAGATTYSGLDVLHAYHDYKRDRPNLSPSEAQGRLDAGHSLELRTNLLLAGTGAVALATAALGVFAVDFGKHTQAAVSVAPNRVDLRLTF